MKEELEQKLFKDFPNMYKPERPQTEALMCYGFMCGDGWFDIIYKLSEDIQNLNPPEDFEVFEVKEKFGGLRFYVENSNKEIDALIYKTEEASYFTCEVCGKPGKPRGSGWIRTLCEEHFKE